MHFGHVNVIRHCGFLVRQVDHIDSVLIGDMWKVVKPEDTLWIAGDFAFCTAAGYREWLEAIFGHLPGREKHLVIGNRDGVSAKHLPRTSVSRMAKFWVGGRHRVLCHCQMIT